MLLAFVNDRHSTGMTDEQHLLINTFWYLEPPDKSQLCSRLEQKKCCINPLVPGDWNIQRNPAPFTYLQHVGCFQYLSIYLYNMLPACQSYFFHNFWTVVSLNIYQDVCCFGLNKNMNRKLPHDCYSRNKTLCYAL